MRAGPSLTAGLDLLRIVTTDLLFQGTSANVKMETWGLQVLSLVSHRLNLQSNNYCSPEIETQHNLHLKQFNACLREI